MFKLRFIVLCLLALLVVSFGELSGLGAKPAPSSIATQPTVRTYYRYYPIQGSTATELRSQMSRMGPMDRLEKVRYDANMDWLVKWSYQYLRSGQSCRLGAVKSDVTITFTLPKWNSPVNVERSLVNDWKQYMAALQIHENGHKDNGIAASRRIIQTLNQLPAASSCQALETSARTATRQVISYYNQQDIDYDRRTRHGYIQGAVFPQPANALR